MDEQAVSVLPAAVAHDLSPLALFMQADPVVKGVMLLLALASVICWAIILDKSLRLMALRREAGRLELAAAAGRLDAYGRPGLALTVLAAGRGEWQDRDPRESRAEVRERLECAMRAAVAGELRRVEPGLPFLATTGSAAPFLGLFGTVWGIMNSFSAIAQSNDTSLAVVAPGIAEALFATAIGLAAAIPAVVAYNKLAVGIGRAAERMHAAIATLGAALLRQPASPQAGEGQAQAVGWR